MQEVGAFRELLGEGPVWCEIQQALYWADIRRRLIRRFAPATGETATWELPDLVGSFALRADGGVVVALGCKFAFFDPQSGSIKVVAEPEPGKPTYRFNDGKCDPAGRFLAGSMDDVARGPTGTLWSLAGDGAYRPLLGGCRIPNGLAWSPDGRTMYFSDTAVGVIRAYDYNVSTGEVGSVRLFAHIENGGPDGGTVDEQGYYWCAIYGGWRLERRAPNGRLDRVIELPMQNPTSCIFGGSELDCLYVTSASQRLSQEELAVQPLAGAVLVLDVGVRGLPSARFNG